MKIFYTSLLSFFTLMVAAKPIQFQGSVTDAQTGEALPGATIYLEGTTGGTITDLAGKYTLDVSSPGTYVLVCRYVSYQTSTSGAITIDAGEVRTLNFSLQPKSIDLEVDVEISARANRASTNYMLNMQKKSARVMDGLSKQQIAHGGDSNAAGALKRVTGVSVEEGKYVYVRGLSDRYGKTLLNGGNLPGIDPKRNSVQLDLIPTHLVDNISIAKTYTPDLPGDFTGGLVNIHTADFPDRFTFEWSSSLEFNTNATFNDDFISVRRHRGYWLARGTKDRQMPRVFKDREIPSLSSFQPDLNLLGRMTNAFENNWEADHRSPFFNYGHSLTAGSRFKVLGKTVGFNAGMTYSKSNAYYDESTGGFTGRYSLVGTAPSDDKNLLNPERELSDRQGTEEVSIGALVNTSVRLNKFNSIRFTVLHARTGEGKARYQEGGNYRDDLTKTIQIRSAEYMERNLTTAQLSGKHELPGANNLEINWMAMWAGGEESIPDFRLFTNSRIPGPELGDSLYLIESGLYPVPARFYKDLTDRTGEGRFNMKYPLFEVGTKQSFLAAGTSILIKNRAFNQSRFDFRSENGYSFSGSVSDYFDLEDGQVARGVEENQPFLAVHDGTDLQNSYRAGQAIVGTYLMADLWAGTRWRAIFGARYETTGMELTSADPSQENALLKGEDILPSINVVHYISEPMKVHGAYSKTIARPTFHELAPFALFDFRDQYTLVGNPSLSTTRITNFDLRWEFFPELGELIALSPFVKIFDGPIEKVVNPEAANFEVEFKNNDRGRMMGVEAEFRKKLTFVSESLKNFSLGVNLIVLHSEVRIDSVELVSIRATRPEAAPVRPMFGQSDWIVNTLLSYENDKGWSAHLNFNISGPKISLITKGGTPNIYERPKPVLDFNASKSFGQRWGVSFSCKNLLNSGEKRSYHYFGREYIFQKYKPGQDFAISLRYKI